MFLISDLLTGGDLRYHIGKRRKFNEEETKFMIACMVLGLEYMHNQGVIHRDIKPENIVMEENGYVWIDFPLIHFQMASLENISPIYVVCLVYVLKK